MTPERAAATAPAALFSSAATSTMRSQFTAAAAAIFSAVVPATSATPMR
jgi:hypothetical protein